MLRSAVPCLAVAALAFVPVAEPPAPAGPQDQFADVVITAEHVAGDVHALFGAGGNMAVLTGPDGALLVDDQFAPLTDRILAAVSELGDEPVRFVVNTHWHGDHTGGNENMGEAGATVVAHENVRARMGAEQVMEMFGRTVPASPEGALPRITFDDGLTFHWNGETVAVMHVPSAHTDGDAIIHFRDADVFHMGDTFFHGSYPFIDTSSGGDVDGVIAAAERVLSMCTDTTRIVPGHGALASPDDLRGYLDMLEAARATVADLVERGLDREAVVAENPTAAWDEAWGGGFIPPEAFASILYDGVTRR